MMNAETREMITFRLQEAGYRSRAPLFTEEAIEDIHDYTEGYPRRIAMLCHQALRALVTSHRSAVDGSQIEEVIHHEVDAGWSRPRRLQKSNC